MSRSSHQDVHPHIALLPSSGMGHLTPFLRLAASLAAHDIPLTLITYHPTVSLAESQALSKFSFAFPQITQQEIQIPPINHIHAASASLDDPFMQRYEVIRSSPHLLSPLLTSLCPSISAVITDMSLTSMVVPITKSINIPNYIFFTTSIKMLAIYASYHEIVELIDKGEEEVLTVPGLESLPKSWLPPPLLSKSNNMLKAQFKENGEKFLQSNGILTNSFEELESESLRALNNGLVVDQLPPVMAIGPLPPCSSETWEVLTWLDDQPTQSVLYVSFGTRATISKEQLHELGNGLVKSGYRFLWVVKGSKVDREDHEKPDEMLAQVVRDQMKQKGVMVSTWMNQEKILNHRAINGFLSHCGWNSITEALRHGIPILAWPQNADQKINAALVERSKVGMWEKAWGWERKEVVGAEEIARKIKELMENKLMREQAWKIRHSARTAVGPQGSSTKQLIEIIESLK